MPSANKMTTPVAVDLPEIQGRWVTVRKAIGTALDAIHSADPVVARHLITHVRTGVRCSYEPDPDAPVEWRL
jgi:hypothetical protein